MEYNVIATGIELIGTRINYISVKNSIDSLRKDAKRNMGLNIHEPLVREEEGRFISKMTIDFEVVVDQDEEQNLSLQLSVEGVFLSQRGIEEEKFLQLVVVNGAAAIIGIARGKIESITASVFSEGKIVIPFVNVLDFYREVAKKTRPKRKKTKTANEMK